MPYNWFFHQKNGCGLLYIDSPKVKKACGLSSELYGSPTQFEVREGFFSHFCQSATYELYEHFNGKINIEPLLRCLKIEIGMIY